jgi:hypothetical protein
MHVGYHYCEKGTNCVFIVVFGNYSEESCCLYEMYLHFLVRVSILFMSLNLGVLFRTLISNVELQEFYLVTLHTVIMILHVLKFQ